MSEPVEAAPQDSMLHRLREAILAEVRGQQPDLSLRQMAVALTVYLADDPQTVRGLAKYLDVNKPAMTRALDRLGDLDLVRRQADPNDRRSILTQRTQAGAALMQRLALQLQGKDTTCSRSR